MKELNDIVKAYQTAKQQNKQAVLATVVKVVGSSYRRPGARMLITEDGQITGAISGGCLEGDALRKALLAMSQQQNKLEIYDTTNEEDANLGVQLGCDGIVYILFEPVTEADINVISLLTKAVQERKDSVLATVFNPDKKRVQTGTICFVNNDENINLSGAEHGLVDEAITVLNDRNSVIKQSDVHSVLFQFVAPAIHLVIAGAGNDAQPLTEMASLLGWQITVADGRPAHATAQRFPKANAVWVAKPQQLLSFVETDSQTAAVLMTHNYNYDLALLEQLLGTDCAYIGVLGPKKKLQRMLDEVTEKGKTITQEHRSKLYGPVGLDIGAETSEEIAASIIAEIKAVLSNRSGASLKERPAAIHNRSIILQDE